jgi:hypothetical protein
MVLLRERKEADFLVIKSYTYLFVIVGDFCGTDVLYDSWWSAPLCYVLNECSRTSFSRIKCTLISWTDLYDRQWLLRLGF